MGSSGNSGWYSWGWAGWRHPPRVRTNLKGERQACQGLPPFSVPVKTFFFFLFLKFLFCFGFVVVFVFDRTGRPGTGILLPLPLKG